ncbi:MAG: helix-turn-helix domain-containing protein [Pseudomonadota bacterium]
MTIWLSVPIPHAFRIAPSVARNRSAVTDAVAPLVERNAEVEETIRSDKAASEDATLSVKDVAKLSGVSERTLRDQVKQGKLRSTRIGREILFRRNDIVTT